MGWTQEIWNLDLLKSLFDTDTMSVHIVQWRDIVRKQWKPWAWSLEKTTMRRDKETFQDHLTRLEKYIDSHEQAYIEIKRPHSQVRQIWEYRIVLVSPPVAPTREMTIVRPLVELSLPDYDLPEEVVTAISQPGHGILIAWAPGEGKTTFAQALLQSLDQEKYVLKTIEAPRDVKVWWNVTQYGLAHTSHNELRDILLLTRPDITLFDEVRNTQDFSLFKDLRLSWIWLIGVMHATKAVDAIQRAINVIEMGVISEIIDTVLFIKWWAIDEVLTLKQVVKTPVWMQSSDLARPVLILHSELQGKDLFEIYSYSDNVVVMPLEWPWSIAEEEKPAIYTYAEKALERTLESLIKSSNKVRVSWPWAITLYVPDSMTWRVIWKWGENIERLQKQLGLHISLKSFDELKQASSIDHKVVPIQHGKRTYAEIHLPRRLAWKTLSMDILGQTVSLTANNDAIITIKKKKFVNALLDWAYRL